jgi:6-phosphogluconolactonase (cycloisomerase 2 family)
MDTTGRFLYVVNRDSNTVSGFLLNFATGVLIPMEGQTFAAGSKPVAMLVTGNMQ